MKSYTWNTRDAVQLRLTEPSRPGLHFLFEATFTGGAISAFTLDRGELLRLGLNFLTAAHQNDLRLQEDSPQASSDEQLRSHGLSPENWKSQK